MSLEVPILKKRHFADYSDNMKFIMYYVPFLYFQFGKCFDRQTLQGWAIELLGEEVTHQSFDCNDIAEKLVARCAGNETLHTLIKKATSRSKRFRKAIDKDLETARLGAILNRYLAESQMSKLWQELRLPDYWFPPNYDQSASTYEIVKELVRPEHRTKVIEYVVSHSDEATRYLKPTRYYLRKVTRKVRKPCEWLKTWVTGMTWSDFRIETGWFFIAFSIFVLIAHGVPLYIKLYLFREGVAIPAWFGSFGLLTGGGSSIFRTILSGGLILSTLYLLNLRSKVEQVPIENEIDQRFNRKIMSVVYHVRLLISWALLGFAATDWLPLLWR